MSKGGPFYMNSSPVMTMVLQEIPWKILIREPIYTIFISFYKKYNFYIKFWGIFSREFSHLEIMALFLWNPGCGKDLLLVRKCLLKEKKKQAEKSYLSGSFLARKVSDVEYNYYIYIIFITFRNFISCDTVSGEKHVRFILS